jgi:uncharacterized membrane protein
MSSDLTFIINEKNQNLKKRFEVLIKDTEENAENKNIMKIYKTPIIVTVVMLFLALLDLPIGYYTLLRIVVCGVAIYLAFIAKEIKKIHWVWIMGFIGILFNPFIPIHMDKEIWNFVDIIAGFTFIIALLVFIGKKKWAWRVGSTVFFITFLILSISYFEAEQAKLAQQARWELLDRERKEAQHAKEYEQRQLEEQKRLELEARRNSDFSFQNQDFKVKLLQPDRLTQLRPNIVFKFEYEIINENKLFYFKWPANVFLYGRRLSHLDGAAKLRDNFGNYYELQYRGSEPEEGRFGFGHKGTIIFATTEQPVPNATHLYLEITSGNPYLFRSIPDSLKSLLGGRIFVISIDSISRR